MITQDKWILITGASTGIGHACTEYLASKGYKIYAGARKKIDLKELDALKNVKALKLDVTQQETVDEAVNIIKNTSNSLFALINNAGIALAGPLMDISVSEIRSQFEVNLLGVHRVTQAVFPFLLESQGKIFMMSSNSGFFAAPFFGPYNASKFALEGYSDSLRRELSLFKVDVIILEPGRINTPIWDKGRALLDKFKGSMFEKYARGLGEYAIKQGKEDSLDPKEVAEVIYEALIDEKPKTRYLVVPDKFRNKLLKILPDRTIDKILAKQIKKLSSQ